MTKMNDLDKVAKLVALLEANGNKITSKELLNVTGTPRRARRALFIARKGGMKLESIRDGGRAVVAYMRTNDTTFQDVETALASKRKRQPKPQAPATTEEFVGMEQPGSSSGS